VAEDAGREDQGKADVAARLEEARARFSTAKMELDALTSRSRAGEDLVREVNAALRQYQKARDAVDQLVGEDRVARGLDRDPPRRPTPMYGPPVTRPGWLARFFGRK
jgi:hypothetical protein